MSGRSPGRGACGRCGPFWASGMLCSLRYPVCVSPTVLRVKGFRFYFFSREEPRAHVHVQHAEVEAKFWILAIVELNANYNVKTKSLVEGQRLLVEHANEILNAWAKHIPRERHKRIAAWPLAVRRRPIALRAGQGM